MRIVVDSNIVFSALLKTKTVFGDVILNSAGAFDFFCPRYLIAEIQKHWPKLKQVSKLSDAALNDSFTAISEKIVPVDEKLISRRVWRSTEKLMADIDVDDIAFVALARHLRAKLWTGDKKLLHALPRKGFSAIIATSEVRKIWLERTS